MIDDLFTGLPAEFSPPEKAADHIAGLVARAEREAYWIRIPPPWRVMIGDFARLAIAMRICEIGGLEARRAALLEVPEVWLDEVRWHVTRVWRWRALCARLDREAAEKRAARESWAATA